MGENGDASIGVNLGSIWVLLTHENTRNPGLQSLHLRLKLTLMGSVP